MSVEEYLDRQINLHVFDLQFFASDEKTEEATPKKKSEARRKGQIARSPEISSAVVLLVFFLFFNYFGINTIKQLLVFMQQFFTEYLTMPFTLQNIYHLYIRLVLVFFQIILPFAFTVILFGLVVDYFQVGWLFTLQPLQPKFHMFHINSMFKKIFSPQTAVNMVKSAFKVLIISYFTYQVFMKEWPNILALPYMDFTTMSGWLWKVIFTVGMRIGIFLLVLALADYWFQRYQHKKSLRMTKQEVKDEYKQAEGDPKIKGKIRQKQMEMALRRMMHAVPTADVVITNPTHLAIALRYNEEKMKAPLVIAKGEGYIALRIREIAEKNGIVVVENPPVAQALYKTVEIGQEVPAELYQVVAEILAFVYRLKKRVL